MNCLLSLSRVIVTSVVLSVVSLLFFPCHSQDPLPSLSSVTRNEEDDMYVLPALPPAEEMDESRSGAWER